MQPAIFPIFLLALVPPLLGQGPEPAVRNAPRR